ncbi:MAG: lipocalin family protein [Halioglobus sp.]|nr:lipocalin family protein [Halioglobus sp.]
MRYLSALFIFLLISCTGTPAGINPVENFDLDRYLGDWYEIARLDHSFERGLDNVRASYSLNPDGSVKVINSGFSEKKKKWEEAVGEARFVDSENVGYLQVSFFGPFYASYVIFKLDKNYQYAYVTGHNRDFLWLLSRTPAVSESRKADFMSTVADLGFDADRIIFVKQDVSQQGR